MSYRNSPRRPYPTEPEFKPRRVNNPFRITRRHDSMDRLDKLISSYPRSPNRLRTLDPEGYSPNYRNTNDYVTRNGPSWERQYFTDRSENPYLHSTLLRSSPEGRTWSDPVVAVENEWNSRPDAMYRHYQSGSSYQMELEITHLNLLCNENAAAHHTSKYDQVRKGNLVVRRGQRFDLYIQCNREINQTFDKIGFVFNTGRHPTFEEGTYAEFYLNRENKIQWQATIVQKLSSNGYIIGITAPPYCIPSGWRLTIHNLTFQNGQHKAVTLDYAGPIFILFNPWCIYDNVYFPYNSDLLNEYIENDSGAIFIGNYKQIGAKPWFFGQFEDGILESSLYCLHKTFNFKLNEDMGDPVIVSRAISRIINSQGDEGVLVGNWSGDYKGGISPLKWSGSVAILRQYMQTKKPVKFGQCFVYSGIVTTVCRAIGIPCRSVTNFASAHDTDGSTTIDVYWDIEKGVISDRDSKDSVWNFHVWNDVFMRRRDLPPGFSGWQAVDATPQERSNGKMQCGPASLRGIKEGLIEHSFDGPFVFAEVNGDKINWSKEKYGTPHVLSVESSAIGKMISTKIPDGRPIPSNLTDVKLVRQDITNEYKYAEDSSRERKAVMAAQRFAPGRKPYYDTKRQDIQFDGFKEIDYILIGSDFESSGYIRNLSNEMRSFEATFTCESVTYDGRRLATVKKQNFSDTLQPRSAKRLTVFVRHEEYAFKMNEQGCMKVSLVIQVLETGQRQAWQDDFRLRRPDLTVQIRESRGQVLRPMECRVSFKNPLPYTALTNCTVTIEGSGFEESEKPLFVADIPPYERWVKVLTLTPTKPGRRQVFVTFNSDMIEDISGAAEVDVR